MNVACVDKGVVIARFVGIVDRGVERIGETVLEHPEEFGIDGCKLVAECFNLFLHGITAEQTFLHGRTLVLDGALHRLLFFLLLGGRIGP